MPFKFKKRGTPQDEKRVLLAMQATRASQRKKVNGGEKTNPTRVPSLPRLKCQEAPFVPENDHEELMAIFNPK